MNGVRLACLYSYKCQRATALGIDDQLFNYIQFPSLDRERRDSVISMLKKLASYPKYRLISESIGNDNFFSKRIVEAYWLGDKELTFNHSNHNFGTLGKFRDINADEHLPVWILRGLLDCAISVGRVIKTNKEKAEVLSLRLLYKQGKVFWGEEKRNIDAILISDLEKGDLVSIHYSIARERISQEKAETLEQITLKALEMLKLN